MDSTFLTSFLTHLERRSKELRSAAEKPETSTTTYIMLHTQALTLDMLAIELLRTSNQLAAAGRPSP